MSVADLDELSALQSALTMPRRACSGSRPGGCCVMGTPPDPRRLRDDALLARPVLVQSGLLRSGGHPSPGDISSRGGSAGGSVVDRVLGNLVSGPPPRAPSVAHELIKLKMVADRDERDNLVPLIEARLCCECVGTVGKVAILYRENPDPEKRTTVVPG